ncbi:putative Heat shock protein 70 family [Helianthus debilis subsp. tardiflorus]
MMVVWNPLCGVEKCNACRLLWLSMSEDGWMGKPPLENGGFQTSNIRVIGFDIGNESRVIAAAKRGGIDVLLSDESKRETPVVVSFGEKQRFLGSSGAAFSTANPKSTGSQIKRLIGKQYKHEQLKLLPFVTTEGPRGSVLIELYLKTTWKFTPVEILAMLYTHLKHITEKDLNLLWTVIGIPSYFTDS